MSSGSQVGGVVGGIVGGIIGFYAGDVGTGVRWGYAIGSAVGGYVDPTRTYGPRLSDASAQTSTVGGPIPFGYGIFTCAGNIIWADELKEHKKTERVGKGGSEKLTTYTYTRSYAIGVCEGPIYQYVWVKKNGKLVYAADPAGLGAAMGWDSAQIADLAASSAEFLKYVTLYYGTDSQMPDSTMVAVEGVGNVGGHRDLAYNVMENEDLTDLQGAVSQFEYCINATQPEAYLTSKPYSQFFGDSVSERARFEEAGTRKIMLSHLQAPENATLEAVLVSASTKSIFVDQIQPPETMGLNANLIEAGSKDVFVTHAQPPENMEYSVSLDSAGSKKVLVPHDIDPEELALTATFVGASGNET